VRGYKTELDLTNVQRTHCLQHAGAARFAYNWGLRRKKEAFQNGEQSPSARDLHKELNARKPTTFPWMYEVSKCAPQEALRDLDTAFAHFFRKCRLKKQGQHRGKCGFPRFKSRKRGIGSFRLTGRITVTATHIKLPRLGWLRLKEHGYLPTDAHILSATVSEQAGHWFVSVQVAEVRDPPTPPQGEPIGVDLGVTTLATLSDGRTMPNPKALRTALNKVRRAQRRLSRRKKGSKNRAKARRQLATAHYRVANIRRDALHKATATLVQTKAKSAEAVPTVVVIEDLHVAGMVKNHHLAQAISDAGFGEFRRQLTYKAAQRGITLLIADRFYPSSKRCSGCGAVKRDRSLATRTYVCEACGLVLDRDVNAARNLAALAKSNVPQALRERNACGDGVSPGMSRPSSEKQEPTTEGGLSTFG
jgi:putative transposase